MASHIENLTRRRFVGLGIAARAVASTTVQGGHAAAAAAVDTWFVFSSENRRR